jgi:phosphatidylserine decarboxylase
VRILFRQIAGAVARRIVWYARAKDEAKQGEQFGFIKFGSRIDIFLPLDAEIKVQIGDKTVGKETILAHIPMK